MRKNIQLFTVLIVSMVCFAVIGSKSSDPANPASERREIRENRRAERQAQMEQEIDSIMMAKAWIFRPQSIQLEPAGRMQFLSNPLFEIRVWDGVADVYIPYITGVVPPYRHVIINYTLPLLKNYIAVRDDSGWQVTFESSLFSASTYTFKFEINTKFATTQLTLSNTWNNDVSYTGVVSRIY